MSYTIHITFQDGEPVVSTSGEVPEGVWSIGGHGDDTGVGINVVHKTLDGQHLAEAQHYRSKWAYDDVNFVAASRDDLPTRLVRLGFSRERAEQYAERGRIKYGRTVLDPPDAPLAPKQHPHTEHEAAPQQRCGRCLRVVGMSTAPCEECPDFDIPGPDGERM